MKASELRIGSYFLGYDDEVFDWDTYHFFLIHEYGQEPDEIGKPIPLTEEWLLKFGFVIDGNDAHLYKIPYDVRRSEMFKMEKRYGEWEPYRYYYGYHLEYKLEYVHQLQNLYHALTGHELKTKQDDK